MIRSHLLSQFPRSVESKEERGAGGKKKRARLNQGLILFTLSISERKRGLGEKGRAFSVSSLPEGGGGGERPSRTCSSPT